MEVNISFWELINQYQINIPIIQRDYAQGRVEEKERREMFLKVLYDCLTTNNSLSLDFVYGRKDKNKDVFFPIDGQQRLTTLFLLHWYVAKKECIDKGTIQKMENFVYATRISSREFCKAIIYMDIQLPESDSIVDNEFAQIISNKYWFRDIWKNDPTIQAMLVMLQSIHEKFHSISNDNLWDKLTNIKLITFQILDLGEKDFELTDELYIKMNARGKQLTIFENFKASFIKSLKDIYTDNKFTKCHPINNKSMTYCDYFSYCIEKEWCDLFWQYKKTNEKEKTYTIDDSFMNFFIFIAQMCYFQKYLDKTADEFNNDFTVFKNEENLLFLFDVLDRLYQISLEISIEGINKVNKEKINNFFLGIFQVGEIDNNYNENVRLFDDESKGVNLFERCLLEGKEFETRNRIILYCVLKYIIKYNLTSPTSELKWFIRIIRNLLQATRQRNETVYNTDVRMNNFGKYWILFEQLMRNENVYDILTKSDINNSNTEIAPYILNNEKQKAEIFIQDNKEINTALFLLEEFNPFSGLIHHLRPKENSDKLIQYSKAIREIWSKNNKDSLIIGAMIASGFNGFYTKNCNYGTMEMKFFGGNNNWHTILTGERKDEQDIVISDSILSLLNNYMLQSNTLSSKDKLDNIIKAFKSDIDIKGYSYYFLEYPEMLNHSNYFAWNSDFEIRLLGSNKSNPLLAYHINPYVLVVSNALNNSISESNQCYSIGNNFSGLVLKNNVILYCKKNGWEIKLPENYQLDESVKKEFNINEKDLILEETMEKDRIKIAIDFAKALF